MEVSGLANIKSAKKRILVIETKTLRNKMIKSKIKTLVKKVEAAIEANDKAAMLLYLLLIIVLSITLWMERNLPLLPSCIRKH